MGDAESLKLLLSTPPRVQWCVARKLNRWVRSKVRSSQADVNDDFSGLLVSCVWSCKSETSNARQVAVHARSIERKAAPNVQERRLREDTVLMLLTGGQALEWIRLRELLLASSDE